MFEPWFPTMMQKKAFSEKKEWSFINQSFKAR
jgi:hypothetical protein